MERGWRAAFYPIAVELEKAPFTRSKPESPPLRRPSLRRNQTSSLYTFASFSSSSAVPNAFALGF